LSNGNVPGVATCKLQLEIPLNSVAVITDLPEIGAVITRSVARNLNRLMKRIYVKTNYLVINQGDIIELHKPIPPKKKKNSTNS